jgi:methyl-accepting chemotaxis protein
VETRRKLYIDPEIQFPLILALIALVTVEGAFVGWGFSNAIAAAKEWERPDQAARFFRILIGTLIPVVAVNFAAGTWLTNKIAGPLARLRQGMSEIARGNLETVVQIRSGDLLHKHVHDFNLMTQTLRRLIYRDHKHAAEIDDIMTQARGWLSRQKDLPETSKADLEALINAVKSRQSIINAHFMKGKTEQPKERE